MPPSRSSKSPRSRTPVACLSVLASPDKDALGRVHLLGMATYVGREPAEPELVWIADTRLDIRHCRILRERDCYTVEDLGSAMGSFVEGRPVGQPQPIRPGELLRCGDTLLLMGELDLAAVRWVHSRHSGLVGGSSRLIRTLRELAELARQDAPVVLTGEPGSGRERLAWELHRQRGRGGPLLSYDCAAVPTERHLGDILGRDAGEDAEPGIANLAGRGTLFLGNVDALEPAVARQIARWFGLAGQRPGTMPGPRPWLLMSAAGAGAGPRSGERGKPGRQLLPALCSARVLTLAPLRERREDILPLLQHFLASSRLRRRKKPRMILQPDLLEAMLLHPWPGNADELRTAADRLLLLGGQAPEYGVELAELLGLAWRGAAPGLAGTEEGEGSGCGPAADEDAGARALPAPPPRGQAPSTAELASLMQAFGGQIRRVARYLGRDRSLVYRWLDKAGLLESRQRW